MYAIVDIETTGGYAAANDITEIAIVIHDGNGIVERFESLVRPTAPIPYYIQVLTGINHEMVARAPRFEDLAPEIHRLLDGKVFLAHNVNFDYSFIKHHLSGAGFELDIPRVCTVRLSKKVFPGMPSYSLGNLCRELGIQVENRHRAGGDATATTTLFEKILANNGMVHLAQALKKKSREQSLPPNLPKEQVDQLPYTPGVYYFHDQKGKIIYVGKAKNLKYRVCSHFSNNNATRQRQEFLRNIHSISFQPCGTELIAFILESIEIKRLWPQYNSSQKRFTPQFGLYSFEDQKGYMRLVIEKQRKGMKALYTFNLMLEGSKLLGQLIREFNLCPRLCFVNHTGHDCADVGCNGACEGREAVANYNHRVLEAIEHLNNLLPSFAVVDSGKHREEQSCILIEKGRFYGMGYIPTEVAITSLEELKSFVEIYPENDYIRGLVYQYVAKKPEKKLLFNA